MIELRGIRKSFGDLELLRGVDLKIEKGETVMVIGPPGNGKSLLLKIVAGLIEPDEGEVLIDGKSITRATGLQLDQIRRRMGMLFQQYALFDSMSVRDNLSFAPRELTDLSEDEIHRRVRDSLASVKLKNVEDLKPSELSGGMKKRVGIARAWVMQPEVIIYDEPTAGLDPVSANRINDLIREYAKNHGATAIAVTQEMLSAFYVSDRVAFLCNGKIMEVGTPDELRASTNPYIQQFLEGRLSGPITDEMEELVRSHISHGHEAGAS
ncbi:MAG: ATP-binding cassette domain-containing protein [Chrysiogenetes bacterium]|nr:ATP-binding cassette domain-containing protein [Chrysiogenetes bacterium]